jgi:hypothetical protein
MSYLSYSSKRLIQSKEFALNRLENLNEIRESDQKIIDEVRGKLLAMQADFQEMAEIKFYGNRKKLADSIEEMARNIIRPMSHELASKRKRRTKNYSFNILLSEGLELKPNTMSQGLPWVMIMFLAFQGGYIFNHSALADAVIIVVIDLLGIFLILTLMIKFFTRFKFTRKSNLLFILTFLLFAPLIQTLVLNFMGKGVSIGEFSSTYLLLIIVFFVAQISNTYNIFEENAINFANQKYMKEFDLVLRDSNTSINDEIVRFLHGTLQTKLAASALRFRNVEDSSFDLASEISNVLSHFEIEAEFSSVIIDETLADKLVGVMLAWEPLIEIELVPLEVDVFSISRLQSSNICDFINECLSNALRHGQATNAKIQISEVINDILVVVTNNGELVKSLTSGLGSKIFTRLSNSRWDIKNKIDGSGVRVSALFSQ